MEEENKTFDYTFDFNLPVVPLFDTNNLLPSSLSSVPHLAALDNMYRDRINLLPLSNLLVYLIDLAPPEVLEVLAVQYDMTGYNGWFLANTTEQKRDLIKRAVSIKRTVGTPYSIREAARSLGIIGEIDIKEGVGSLYDGSFKFDGSKAYEAQNWAVFTITINKTLNPALTSARIDDFKRMIEEFKPQRSRLGGIFLE